ncbi:MAG TPA: monofunctional biosynthetic peptidoglycan transglycosylase [Gammaproteobacteria bacterium]
MLSRLFKRLMQLLLVALATVVLIDGLYLASIWPDWEVLSQGPVPKSNFILRYEEQRKEDGKLPPLRWTPVALQRIAPMMGKAAIAAEDSRFYEHEGIDTEAIQEAMEKNLEKGKVVYGASTISQQTVKNMFLSGSRDYLRKWHELLLTWSMERNLSKPRILEIYLNVAEFGPGVYGVEAASHYYWNIPASALSYDQAVQLAACLPSPKKHNPKTNTRTFQRRVAKIARHLKAPETQASEAAVEPAPANPAEKPAVTPLVEPLPTDGVTPPVEPTPADAAPEPAAVDPAPDTPTPTPP